MKETLRTEWNKTYTRENNIIKVERKEMLGFYDIVRWTATDVNGDTLAEINNYTNTEIDTIERLLKQNGYNVISRVASNVNVTVFEKTC